MSVQILAAGTTAADSSDVVLDQGEVAVLSLFVASGVLSSIDPPCAVLLKTTGQSVAVGALDRGQPAVSVQGPGTYFVRRPAGMTVAVGADSRK